ncbi:unnamed protein product [Caretta caretta]
MYLGSTPERPLTVVPFARSVTTEDNASYCNQGAMITSYADDDCPTPCHVQGRSELDSTPLGSQGQDGTSQSLESHVRFSTYSRSQTGASPLLSLWLWEMCS